MSRPIDKEFEEADDTGVLDISGRKLRQFPAIAPELLDITYVFEADLSVNRFDRIPKEVLGFKALVKLNCHDNSIRWLLEELYLLSNLKEIDLSRNFISRIPDEWCHMNLYSINLSNNRLVSIPGIMGQLKNLQFLDLSCNALSDLPGCFTQLESLRHLNLHRNQLRDLPLDVDGLWQLEYLDVSSNDLSRLPLSLRHISSLQVFLADDNPLEYPPSQVCVRGLVHICKYLEVAEKRGDGYLSNQRDESLRRKKERSQKKNSTYRPLSESTPVRNGDEGKLGLLDEMANFVNQAFGERDGEKTPTGVSNVHWSVAQFMNAPNQSKEEYREATHRQYMAQEGHKPAPCPSSPAGSSSLGSLGEISTTPTSSLPKRKSDENVYRSSTVGSASDSRPANFVGRSLSNEKFPRSGSWNSHMRISSPVLPSKYVASSDKPSDNKKSSTSTQPTGLSSKSATELSSADSAPPATQPTSPPKKSKRPPPLDTKKPQNGDKGADSDHEGSLTPTNEEPPTLELSEEPTTPKDDETFSDLPNSEANGSSPSNGSAGKEAIPVATRRSSKPLPTPPTNRHSTSSNTPESPDIEIRDLDSSPTSLKRLPSVSEEEREAAVAANADRVAVPEDNKWQRLTSPRRRKEKDVFKFLKENDANYTIRRQQMQINIMLEKNQHVKKTVENLVGIELSDDIGEWVTDGVVLCKVINILHPGTISTIHTPPPGQKLSRIKQTINISAFIDACKSLHISEEELCSAGDIVELKDPVRVITCLQRVLETKPGNLI